MKMKKYIPILTLGILLSLVVIPTLVFAQVQNAVNITRANIIAVITTLRGWISGIVGMVGVIVIIYAAILYMLAGGDEEKTATAKKALVGGVIGVALAVIAWGIFGLVSSFLSP